MKDIVIASGARTAVGTRIDLIEANEAFAAQACAVTQELGADPAKVNPNGSGIALATRSEPPGRSSRSRRCTSCSASAAAMRW